VVTAEVTVASARQVLVDFPEGTAEPLGAPAWAPVASARQALADFPEVERVPEAQVVVPEVPRASLPASSVARTRGG
jgi:hypothetical protein